MRFICPACKFDEREDAGLLPVSVCCPQCRRRWAPVASEWRPAPEAPRRVRAPSVEAERVISAFRTRVARA